MLKLRAGLRQEIMAELLESIKARQRQEDKGRSLTGEWQDTGRRKGQDSGKMISAGILGDRARLRQEYQGESHVRVKDRT